MQDLHTTRLWKYGCRTNLDSGWWIVPNRGKWQNQRYSEFANSQTSRNPWWSLEKQFPLMCRDCSLFWSIHKALHVWASCSLPSQTHQHFQICPGERAPSGIIFPCLLSDKATTGFCPLFLLIMSQRLGCLQPLSAFLQISKSLPGG